jgi:hypothetical protein
MANRSLKSPIGLRLSADAVALIKLMSSELGISQAAVIEIAIREKAKRDGVELGEPPSA